MRLQKRLAILGDDSFAGEECTIKYSRIQMCVGALSPDIAYVIPFPGASLKSMALLAAMEIPFVIAIPNVGWENLFNTEEKVFLRRCKREAAGVIYHSKNKFLVTGIFEEYASTAAYMIDTCNMFLTLTNGTPKPILENIIMDIDRAYPDMHVIIDCKK